MVVWGERPCCIRFDLDGNDGGGEITRYAYTTGDALFSAANDSAWERLDALDNEPPSKATLAVRPGAPLTVYLAMFGRGVFRSLDGGHIWSPPNADLAGLAVDSIGWIPWLPRRRMRQLPLAANASEFLLSQYRRWRFVASAEHRLGGVHAFRMAVDPANGARIFLAGYQGLFPAGVGGLYLSTNAGIN